MDSSLDHNTFAVADYIVFGFLILISISIGVFFACYKRGQNTTLTYFLGDRQLNVLPVALSFVVTFQSSIIILGFPAEAYAYGMQYCIQTIGVTIAYLLSTVIVVPIFHPMKVTSVYEYFFRRYGNNIVRFIAAILGVMYFIFYMGIVTYGTALALEAAAGFPFWISVTIFSSAAVLYTSIGGIRAVIWTDVFQSLVMLAGIMAVLIKCTFETGGSKKVFELAKSRLNFFDFNPDPTQRHTFWTLVFGSISQFLYLTFTQSGVQRINSTPSVKTAKRIMYIAAPVYSIVWIVVMFEGITVFAYFSSKECDPLKAGKVRNLNQIIPFTVMELFRSTPGLPGLFIAALSAASLSTISSGLSSLAAVAYEDVIKIHFPNMNQKRAIYVSKSMVVLFGVLSVGITFLLSNVKGPLGQIMASFMGAIDGPTTGLFLLSIFCRRTTTKGAVSGIVLGFGFIGWIAIGQNFGGVVEQTPYLPLGPVTQCLNGTATMLNTTNTDMLYYDINTLVNQTGSLIITQKPTIPPKGNAKSGLQLLYSISYMYFNLIGAIITIVVGLIISHFTQPEVPTTLDENCILPLTCLVPSFLRNKLCRKKYGEKDSEENGESHAMMQNGSHGSCDNDHKLA